MSFEETEAPPSHTLDDVLGWLEDSLPLTPLPSFDESYLLDEFDGSQTWEWDQNQDPELGFLHNQDANANVGCETANMDLITGASFNDSDPPPEHGFLYSQDVNANVGCETTNMEVVAGAPFIDSDPPSENGFFHSYSQDHTAFLGCEGPNIEVVTRVPVIDSEPPPELQQPNGQSKKRDRDGLIEAQQEKRSARSKRKANKSSEKSCKDGDKDMRWAEQLLNPCALAITANNTSKVQHYLIVLSELASSSGDANYRLADFGLRALRHYISSSSSASSSSSWPDVTFASAEVKMFQRTLLKFYEVNPWFAWPNNMANSAILQILAQDSGDRKDLHVLDIGVSHGMQWPTLLEALSCRPEGPPPRVRITVLSDLTTDIPFSVGPPSYNYGSQLISFALSLNINLQISVLDTLQLIETSPHETLIVCSQFRLKHSILDERSEILKALRSLGPKGVVLCENVGECTSTSSGDFAARFSRKLEYLWKFLDSTSAGFKEENSEERKLMEGEATKVLMHAGEMNEGKGQWYERMRHAGFSEEAFGEDAIDGAKSLLRKYDTNWELSMEDGDTFAGLQWKGEAVSFCSLWK